MIHLEQFLFLAVSLYAFYHLSMSLLNILINFYFIKKGNLINKDIHSLETNGAYFFSGGWHIKGIYSLILGFIFSASTIWNSSLMFLQPYAWIIGAFVGAVIYYLLAKE